MKCLRCGGELYWAKEICSRCRRLEKSYAALPREHRAYLEAGHAVMSYLIHNGFTEKFVSLNRTDIVPPFERVSIEGLSANWAKTSFSLGSLIARELVEGYLGEYDYLYPDVRASDWLEEMMAYGEEVLHKHWASVESLATALWQPLCYRPTLFPKSKSLKSSNRICLPKKLHRRGH